MNNGENRKAWQEPMVWLMLGIPVATIVAGVFTLYLAQSSGPLDSVQASVERVGKGQVSNSAADLTALQNNYHAELDIDRHTQYWRFTLRPTPNQLSQAPVDVFFVHANDANRDVRIRLISGRGQLQAPLNFTPQQIVIADQDEHWRLVGRYTTSGPISLAPSLSTR